MMSGNSGFGGMLGGSLGQFLGGMFGNSGQPYSDAMDQYNRMIQQAQGAQNPFLQAGQGAIGGYQNWLNSMKDPSGFINNLMGHYQESPMAKYQQQQAVRSGQNAASASGLSGSTPFAQQLQQNASNISSQDMNSWLQNVLGINNQYGGGLNNLMGYGANAANSLTDMYQKMSERLGDAAYGQRAGQNQDFMNMLGGGLGMLGL